MIWDVRFLPNPYWVPELKAHTGLEPVIAQYVLANATGEEFLQLLAPFLAFLITKFSETKRSELRLAIGCTGGRHRSVAVTEYLKKYLSDRGYELKVFHRDIDKE